MRELEQDQGAKLKKLILIESVSDAKTIIGEYKDAEKMWFRGVRRADYRLLPKAMRNAQLIADQFGNFVDPEKMRFSTGGDYYLYINQERLLYHFKKQVSQTPSNIKTNIDWLFLAQHYGLPTTLLDWSESIEIALWFAISSVKDFTMKGMPVGEMSSDCAAVYVMSPWDFNQKVTDFHPINGPVDADVNAEIIQKLYISGSERAYGPICVKGKPIDRRLINQKGNFTIHGQNIWPLDYYNMYREMITKILIPHNICREILNYIEAKGICEEFVYGGKDVKEEIARLIETNANVKFDEEVKKIRETKDTSFLF